MLRNPQRRRPEVVLAAAALALLLGFGGLAYLTVRSGQRPAASPGPSPSSSGRGLVGKLAQLQSALDQGMEQAQMREMADDIELEIRRQPLPDDDDIQFSAELIVRYLRELAAIENYRALKIGQGEKDPLDPRGDHPNLKSIEVRRNYSAWLRRRTKVLYEALTPGARGTGKAVP